MICSMSPAHTTPIAADQWRKFVAKVEEPNEPECPICEIRHFRDKPQAPYCHMIQQFFLWCRSPMPVAEGPFVHVAPVDGIKMDETQAAEAPCWSEGPFRTSGGQS